MNGVNSYQAYQSSYQAPGNAGEKTKSEGTEAAGKKQKVIGGGVIYEMSKSAKAQAGNSGVQLSDKAKELLQKLQKKFRNTDFMIANYGSEEEAGRLLAQGKKEFSVLIEPEMLEQMAQDEALCAKYEDMIANSQNQLRDMMQELGEDGDKVKKIGISVDKDGVMSFFAELEKSSARQKERIEESKAAKAQEKKKAKQKEERKRQEHPADKKDSVVMANTAEELLAKIRNWNGAEEEDIRPGASIDIKS